MINKITKPFYDIQRAIQILSILTKYGFGYIIDLIPLDRSLTNQHKATEPYSQKLTLPERIRKIAEELGPTFVKLAQIISTRPDLIPPHICHELEKLQDKVKPFEYSKVEDIFQEEFNQQPNSIFAKFNKKPFAAASLSQVHEATLKDGTIVAVKIQRPDITNNIETDLDILFYLAEQITKYIEDSKQYNLTGILKELKKQIFKELDYTIEAQNILRFQQNFKEVDYVHPMKVFKKFSSSKILVVEKINAIKINEIEQLKANQFNLKQIAHNGVEAILKQIFEDGFFHADPHPGNIFVLNTHQLVFIDFGMMGRIDDETLGHLASLVQHIISRDVNAIIGLLKNMNILKHEINEKALRYDLLDFFDRFYGLPLNQINMEKILFDFSHIIIVHQIQVPSEYTLLIKTLLTVEGIGRQLDPEINVFEKAKPFVQKLILKQYTFSHIFKHLKTISSEFILFSQKFPLELRETLTQIREGNTKIEFEHKGLENTLLTLNSICNRIVISIILASIIVGSSLIILSKIPPHINGMSLIGLIGFLSAGVIGFYLIFLIIKNK